MSLFAQLCALCCPELLKSSVRLPKHLCTTTCPISDFCSPQALQKNASDDQRQQPSTKQSTSARCLHASDTHGKLGQTAISSLWRRRTPLRCCTCLTETLQRPAESALAGTPSQMHAVSLIHLAIPHALQNDPDRLTAQSLCVCQPGLTTCICFERAV